MLVAERWQLRIASWTHFVIDGPGVTPIGAKEVANLKVAGAVAAYVQRRAVITVFPAPLEAVKRVFGVLTPSFPQPARCPPDENGGCDCARPR